MVELEEMRAFLKALQLPDKQTTDICCYTMLAILGLNRKSKWKDSTNNWVIIHDVRLMTSANYGVEYAENTRETIRKQAMHTFRDAAFIEDSGRATNSPKYSYRATEEFLNLAKSYRSKKWKSELEKFQNNHETLISLYSSKRKMKRMPVMINSKEFSFSSGKHNELQKAILEEFAPRFAPSSMCLYVGDTEKKDLVRLDGRLREIGFEITDHDKLPDVVLYREDKNWLYFIEAVTSVGPMSQKRVNEIEKMTKDVKSGLIFVTAFLDKKTFAKFTKELAWETEVWIADNPDHMIHLNGDKFLGPRNSQY